MKLAIPGNPLSFLRLWAAPLFAAVLSAITMITFWQVKPHTYDFPAFFCFLPMAFFFGETAQIQSQKQIRDLQQRIAQLEAQSTHVLL